MNMNGRRPPKETLDALYSDIRTRVALQRSMAENTREVLKMELGIDLKVIYRIEHGKYAVEAPKKVTAWMINEVRSRRQAYHRSRKALQKYSVRALCERYNLGSTAIENRIRMVKDEMMYELARRKAA